jgi:hypothetical protein
VLFNVYVNYCESICILLERLSVAQMTADVRACIVKQPQHRMSFEFYSLPTELKRVIFNINKPKYNYEKFVKSFNEQVELFTEMMDLEWCGMEFEGHGAWIDCFLCGGYEEALRASRCSTIDEQGNIEWNSPSREFFALVDANARGVTQHYTHYTRSQRAVSSVHKE